MYPRLFKRPDSGRWYIELDRNVKRSLRTKDKATARKRFNAIRKKWAAGQLAHLLGESKVTLGEYLKEYEAWAELNLPRSTCRANLLALRQLRDVAGGSTRLAAITLRELDAMVTACRKRGLKAASINNYIRHARAALNKAVEWNYLKRNPLAGAKELRIERRQPAFIPDPKEISRVLASIEDMDLRHLATAYIATGRRRSELLRLAWDDVDLKNGRYLIRRSKAHLSRWYPINATFRAVLEAIGPGKGRVFSRWSHPDTISHKIKEALIAGGYPNLTLHSLRHTFASHAIMQGRTLKAVQDLLGHTEARTTEIYAHLADDYLSEAAEIYLGPVDLIAPKSRPKSSKGLK